MTHTCRCMHMHTHTDGHTYRILYVFLNMEMHSSRITNGTAHSAYGSNACKMDHKTSPDSLKETLSISQPKLQVKFISTAISSNLTKIYYNYLDFNNYI